ncbi:MAG TPA: hypothetical protein VM074_02810 [Solimonas sp.]|nr:hypothetical protein [Solimonas sp.]
MNKTIAITLGALIGIAGYTAPALAEVAVNINIGQPGYYGPIELAGAPRPRIIYAQPRIVERVTVVEEPIYLHVRPGQARNWDRYCRDYNACGRRVYFVNDNWYNTVYVQHHQRGHDEGKRGEHERDHDNGRRDDDDRDHDKHGRGHGRQHDNGRRGKGKK